MKAWNFQKCTCSVFTSTVGLLRKARLYLYIHFHLAHWVCRLDNPGSIPGRVKQFFLLQIAHTGCGAHPGSYSVGTRGTFPGWKWCDREFDRLILSGADVQNEWSYTAAFTHITSQPAEGFPRNFFLFTIAFCWSVCEQLPFHLLSINFYIT
jgi:hypothetical protein